MASPMMSTWVEGFTMVPLVADDNVKVKSGNSPTDGSPSWQLLRGTRIASRVCPGTKVSVPLSVWKRLLQAPALGVAKFTVTLLVPGALRVTGRSM